MAIEIRELVVRATVNKTIGSATSENVTKVELLKFQDKLIAKVMSKVKDLLQEERSFR